MLISGGKVIAIDELKTNSTTLSGDGVWSELGLNTSAVIDPINDKIDSLTNVVTTISSDLETTSGNLQEQIDEIGKPLTYSGAKSVADINELEEIKQGTVYTVTGASGTLTAGNINVISGDEIAWGGEPAQWFNIGKDIDNSWKQWSEEHNSSGVDGSIYIGKENSADYIGINIGAKNQILNGDDTLGASINIGKNNVNRYGVLIGQNNESSGYGFAFGESIIGISGGDTVIGQYVDISQYVGNDRIIVGKNIVGPYRNATKIFGENITSFSGDASAYDNNNALNNVYINGIGDDATVIGSNIIGGFGNGSIVIAHNSIYPSVPMYVTGDSNFFGGYCGSTDGWNAGISAVSNATIIGQGTNISAGHDSMIFGNQSIAKDGSKVIGSNGYAYGASLVLNPSPMDIRNEIFTTAYFINGTLLKSSPEIYGANTAFGLYKEVYDSTSGWHYVAEKLNLSGTQKFEMPSDNDCISYFSYFHKSSATNEEGSFAVLNIIRNDTKLEFARGYWNNDGTVFTSASNYGFAAGIIEWTKGAYLLRIENGVKKIYEYNEETSGTVDFPTYFYVRYNSYYPYHFVSIGENSKILTPNILNNVVVTDGEFIYYIPINKEGFYSYRTWTSNYLPTSFSGSRNYIASAAYFNSDDTIDVNVPSQITGYGYNGITASTINSSTTYIKPTAVFNSLSSLITNSTAGYGSVAIGSKNYATGGSIAINAQTASNNNISHKIEYDFSNSSTTYKYKKLDSTGSIITTNDITITSYSTIGFNQYADAQNMAYGTSVAIGVGDYNKNLIQYASLGIGKNVSAAGEGYVIGENLYAAGKSFAIGFNASATNNSLAINGNTGYGGSVADHGSIAIGASAVANDNSFCFNIPLMNINSYNSGYANSGGISIGQGSTAEYDGYAIGGKQYASRHSFALGMKGGAGIFGNRESYDGNYADNISLAIGFNNYAKDNSWSIGFNNNVKNFGWTYGFNNYIWGMGMFLGFGNHDWYGSGSYSNSGDNENVDMFGRWNEVVGYIPTSTSTSQTGKTYETTIIGNNNKLIITGVDSLHPSEIYGYEFAGIFLGKQNESYMASAGGYNIYLGSGNKGAYEAINIGTDNDTIGHSIGLGWHNRAVKGGYAHTILIGNSNNSNNTQGYTYQKSYPYISQKILSESEIKQINNEIKELEEQRTTAYQNFASKANEIYSLLTANGLDSVSAENYIDGTLYSSGYGHSYISPYTPWAIQNYPNGISYKENGTWYTGYGESAYVKSWIYNTSSYSSYDTSDYYYKYYWLPAKQASATWSIVSSIYTAQYGSDSANRYNAVNTAIQHINELSQAIAVKQDKLSQNPITASGTTDSHNIETMSLVVGQGNSADHHNSIVIGCENHTLKLLDTNLTGDDGFTVAIGVGNTVARNYDMAIGYGTVAFGGENIAIGQYIYDSDNEIYRYTSAVGLKNISLRSTVTGFNNVAVDSHLLGTGVSSTIVTAITLNYGTWKTNFEKNKLFDSIPTILGSAYSINNNNFDDIKNTNFTINDCFDRNDLRNIKKTYITAATATDNILHNVYDTVIIDNNNSFNTYTNVISSTLQTNSYNSFNTYKNVTSAYISAGSNDGSNLFYDIGGYGTRFNNSVDLTADYLCHNIVINATITGSSLEWPGISNNFIWKSYVNPYKASAYGQGQVSTYGDSFSENMLIGTEAFNTVHESFSFGALAVSLIASNSEGQNSIEAPILRDCTRVWNFGDNSICHAFDTFVAGLGNELNGVNKFHVLGTNNYVKLKNIDNKYSSNNGSDGFHDSIILGNVNAISTPIDDYDGYRNTRNYIIGQANTIIATSSTLYNNENSDLKIIGNDNHYAGTNSFIAGLLGNGSIYKWVTDIYENSNGYTSSYNSIIPVYYDDSIVEGKRLVSSLSSYPISGASRDMMIGSRNVISNNITDSTIIGFYNAIHQDEQEHEIKFNNSNIIGSYNLAINGSNQFNVGFNNITSGHHSTAIGEELKANAFQTILGKYNASALGTSRTTMKWNSATNSVEHLDNTGVLLAIGNGRLNLYEKWSKNAKNSYSSYNWFDESGNLIPRKNISDEQYIQRSNAMIVSADGTVSSTKLATSGIDDVEAAITALQTQLGNIETALNAIINGSNS